MNGIICKITHQHTVIVMSYAMPVSMLNRLIDISEFKEKDTTSI